jgi:hypothetical protein
VEILAPAAACPARAVRIGDVLVVDTVGANGRARAANGVECSSSRIDDHPRFPLSDRLRLVERFRLGADGELLEDEADADSG